MSNRYSKVLWWPKNGNVGDVLNVIFCMATGSCGTHDKGNSKDTSA